MDELLSEIFHHPGPEERKTFAAVVLSPDIEFLSLPEMRRGLQIVNGQPMLGNWRLVEEEAMCTVCQDRLRPLKHSSESDTMLSVIKELPCGVSF